MWPNCGRRISRRFPAFVPAASARGAAATSPERSSGSFAAAALPWPPVTALHSGCRRSCWRQRGCRPRWGRAGLSRRACSRWARGWTSLPRRHVRRAFRHSLPAQGHGRRPRHRHPAVRPWKGATAAVGTQCCLEPQASSACSPSCSRDLRRRCGCRCIRSHIGRAAVQRSRHVRCMRACSRSQPWRLRRTAYPCPVWPCQCLRTRRLGWRRCSPSVWVSASQRCGRSSCKWQRRLRR
mmetsp:Transcript_99015/g.280450  ORF Transcript_99015/g.280450 Transcript_99015/m.280450 type:complete len:238 (-) Transcript_99015:699-1412(-)